jgi:predicted phage terminase large subunit-like protein
MTVDPAISTKTTADETAIIVGNVTADGRIFVRDVWHGRVGIVATVAKIVQADALYHPVEIGIEAVAYQTALLEIVEERHPELPIVPVTPDRDKVSRFYALGALYEWARIFHHPALADSAFESQLTRLPSGRHDDMADAESYLTILAGVGGRTIVQEGRPAALEDNRR